MLELLLVAAFKRAFSVFLQARPQDLQRLLVRLRFTACMGIRREIRELARQKLRALDGLSAGDDVLGGECTPPQRNVKQTLLFSASRSIIVACSGSARSSPHLP
ncbi:MAG: hypothetical protein CL908_03390 [Deltaproteobacteria bacterium]|nr:hypothetical protein [Deltaproteobacteria bacterium]